MSCLVTRVLRSYLSMNECFFNVNDIFLRKKLYNGLSLYHVYGGTGVTTHHLLHSSSRMCVVKSEKTELVKQLHSQIQVAGPITVANYIKEVLTNPTAGYYMNHDVFGTKGDFTTSPEITQIFGELLGVWCVHEWLETHSSADIKVIELGPGRGTLADDMLRVFSKFPDIKDKVTWHLVEISPTLSKLQYEKLSGKLPPENSSMNSESNHYLYCQSKYGPHVYWHQHISQVPKGFSFYIAQEFFDALPIHKFQYKDGSWHEVLVDIDNDEHSVHHLRFVLSPHPTPALALLNKHMLPPGDRRHHIELSPEAGVIVQDLASRISKHGGAALVVDYGHNGDKEDTFRAFKDHELHEVLSEPGKADLTADVDFSYLARLAAQMSVSVHGPISQERFLHNMGIVHRLQALLKNADHEQKKDLISGYDMITNPSKMGDRFKFLILHGNTDKNYVPAGFKALT